MSSNKIDFNLAQIHILNAYTLGELVAFYSPHSEPDRKDFGNIYMNAGQMIMAQMESAEEIIRAAEDAEQAALRKEGRTGA